MRLNVFLTILPVVALLSAPSCVSAWGPEGHRIVGVNAVAMLDDSARASVIDILGGDSPQLIGDACFWPDTVRKTADWEWSAPLHYVNIPRSEAHFDRERDCRDGRCVTDAIIKYADKLTRPGLGDERRWQALAFLCHFVGDLHQPLHTGYLDDLGGNTVEIEYRGESTNLHQFWDRVVIRSRLGEGDQWVRPFSGDSWTSAGGEWSPGSVACWTDESRAIMARSAYPPANVIDEPFADQTWLIIRQQWQQASVRLARILNAAVGDGEVIVAE